MTYEEVAKIILKDDFPPVMELYRDICAGKELSDAQKKQLRAIFEEDEVDDLELEISEGSGATYFFVYYAIEKDRMAFVDWSGEDDDGEVEGAIRRIVRKYDESFESKFQWDVMAFNGTLDWDSIERGDYIVLLFQAINRVLRKIGYRLVFIDLGNDQYNFTVLPSDQAEQLFHTKSPFDIYDLTEYVVEVTEVPEKAKKDFVLFLKVNLGISLGEASKKAEQLPLKLAEGEYRATVEMVKNKLEELGCTCVVKELEPTP